MNNIPRKHRFGLKLWSGNIEHIEQAKSFYHDNLFDYIELFCVPGSKDLLDIWKDIDIPFILHAPHSYAGFNPSFVEKELENRAVLDDVELFRESLNPSKIVFHPGIDGELNETIRQFKVFAKQYNKLFDIALVENKPKIGLKNEMCVGYSPEQIKLITDETGLGFCLDFGHAINASVSMKRDVQEVVREFLLLKPQMFHLSDGDSESEYDMHKQLGSGNYDFSWILEAIPENKSITIETKGDCNNGVGHFIQDVEFLNRYYFV